MPETNAAPAAATLTDAQTALLQMSGIRKSFGPVQALDDVDFHVAPAEVHGLLGGNGAGKTTLMNVLYGLYRPDAGQVTIDGADVVVRAPRDAISHGIGMVHQSFLQVDSYTVTENVVLGTSQPTLPVLRLGPAERRIRELSERFGLMVDPRARVQDLSVGIRQRVEILKALFRGARLLVLDEPTTNLTPQEVDSLFRSLRTIVDEGMSVVFITHKIRETMAVCDRMSVMRDGRRITTVTRAEVDDHRLAGLMVGEDPGIATEGDLAAVVGESETSLDRDPSHAKDQDRVAVSRLRVLNDHGLVAVRDIDFAVRRGEVLGVTGVAGNGQVELAEALAGVRRVESGSITVDGSDLVGSSTAEWLNSGVAYVPEDRTRDGILPRMSVADNLILGSEDRASLRKRGMIDWSAVRRSATEAMTHYSIKAPGIGAPAGTLSGGNIQRIILARAFAHSPAILLLHNPTRGLDIRSTQFVYDRVRDATATGSAVVLLTEDLDELMRLSDRVIVLFSGAIAGERERGSYDPYEIGRLMTGMRGES